VAARQGVGERVGKRHTAVGVLSALLVGADYPGSP
jgi:hypothetical protein